MATGVFNKTHAKQHSPGAVVFDALQLIGRFDNGTNYSVTSPGFTVTGHNDVSTTIQSRLILPYNAKIFGLYINIASGTLPAANASINVALGTGAEAGTAPPNDTTDAGTAIPATVATAGQSIFAADKRIDNISGLAQDVPVFIVADNPDAVWPEAGLLTLRFVTNGTGTITNLQVALVGFPYDINFSKPINAALAPSDL